MKHRYAGIMAGGSGERFWPLSRHLNPKQLLKLPGADRTLLGDTIDRVAPLVGTERVLVLTAPHLTAAISSSEPIIRSENIVVEPLKRNTAGCLCWLAANLLVRESDPPNVTLAILPADHRISPLESFHETVAAALAIAENDGAIVTIGIRPDRPETGYGYVEADLAKPLESVNSCGAFGVLQFHEKPSVDLATEYVATEGFYWNSGMFFWRLDTFLTEMERVAPKHNAIIRRLVPLIREGNVKEAERVFSELPDISIDYLLMEHASNVAVVEASFQWDDVGSWDAISRYIEADERGNAALGDCVLVHTADCLVHNSSSNLTLCLNGVYDLLVVATNDAILICNKSEVQSVREVVAKLKTQGSTKL